MDPVKPEFWKPKEIIALITEKSNYFLRWPSNERLYVGYHIEDGETFNMANKVPLSMESLHDCSPLFLCANPKEWAPFHFSDLDKDYTFYRILFKPSLTVVYHRNEDYMATAEYDSRRSCEEGRYVLSDKERSLVEAGIGIFLYDGRDGKEISEGFLVHPVRDVQEIHRFSSAEEAQADHENILEHHISRKVAPSEGKMVL